jgi:hypothetical protein
VEGVEGGREEEAINEALMISARVRVCVDRSKRAPTLDLDTGSMNFWAIFHRDRTSQGAFCGASHPHTHMAASAHMNSGTRARQRAGGVWTKGTPQPLTKMYARWPISG